ncbi:MAG: cytochrome c [Gemmatimonadota bacterium]
MKTIHAVAATAILLVAAGCASMGSGSGENRMNTASGAELWRATCSHCHNLRGAQEYTAEQWSIIVSHMRTRAEISRSDAERIAAYLATLSD